MRQREPKRSVTEPAERAAQFPRLARQASAAGLVTATAKKELEQAGIAVEPHQFRGEVPSGVFGTLNGWTFERAWRYWIAAGPALPMDAAMDLYDRVGRQARAGGHGDGLSPEEWGSDRYHCDTPRSLSMLAGAIRSVVAQAGANQLDGGSPLGSKEDRIGDHAS